MNWQLELHPKHQRWYLKIPENCAAQDYPTVELIREAAKKHDIEPRLLLNDKTLGRSIEAALEREGEAFEFPIGLAPAFDVRLIVSQDKTAARLYVRKATSGTPTMDMKLIGTVIANSKLIGLDMERVKADLEAFRQSPAMELEDYLLAEGTPPGRGPHRELVPLIDWMSEDERDAIAPRVIALIGAKGDSGTGPIRQEEIRLAPVTPGAIALSFTPAEYGTPGLDVYGKEIPGIPGNDPYIKSLFGASLGPQGVKAERAGIMAVLERDGVFSVWVFPHADARATVTITPDDMLATIILESEEGVGIPLTLALARKAIEEKGIKGSLDDASIEKGIREARSSKSKRELILAKGKPAVPAGNPVISWNVIFSPDNPAHTVVHGQEIMSWTIATANEDGINVFGSVLKASEAQKIDLPKNDESVKVEPEDPNASVHRMVADRAGELTFRNETLSVSGSRKIEKDVDESSGDVNFPGDLELIGNIGKGRVVRAEGSLTMKGVAEASLVAANGVVFIDGGIKGAGSGTVWSKQTIDLTFAENAKVLAGQDVSIDKYCFQCVVKTNGRLLMKGNPGVLLGGSIQASRGVEVYELGSSKTIRTSISFGQNYLVRDQINVCEKEAETIKETVARLDAEMKKLAGNDPKIHALRQKKLELLKRNDKLTVRVFTLKEQFEAHIMSAIRVENTVWPGVILESHGRYFEVRERRTHVIFIFDQASGQITCSPIPDGEES